MGHRAKQLLWNPVHFTREELILRKVTQPGQKFKVNIFWFSRPDHCAPQCLVMRPYMFGLYSV